MNPIYFSIAVLATLSVLAMPLAQATESTQIDAILIGNSAVDPNGEVGERLVRAYAQFANFDISEKYFNVDVIQLETGNVVSSSQVNVYSTSDGLINFGSLVGYLVPKDSLAGNYQIEISTRNGIMAEPVQFSILS